MSAAQRADHEIWRAYARSIAGRSTAFSHADRFEWSQFPGCGPAAEVFGDLAGQLLLELGCGSGANAKVLASQGACVFALDVAEAYVERGRDSTADMHNPPVFRLSSAEDYLARTVTTFDGIYSVFGALTFADPEVLLPLVRSRLTPAGKLLFSVRYQGVSRTGVGQGAGAFVRQALPGVSGSVRRFDLDGSAWRSSLARHGFTLDQVIEIAAPPQFERSCCLLMIASICQGRGCQARPV